MLLGPSKAKPASSSNENREKTSADVMFRLHKLGKERRRFRGRSNPKHSDSKQRTHLPIHGGDMLAYMKEACC